MYSLPPQMQYFVALMREGVRDLDDVIRLPIVITCDDANGRRYRVREILLCTRPAMKIEIVYQGQDI